MNLTPAEREALTILAEECSEVAQACCKALRHGLSTPSSHSSDGKEYDNAAHIAFELAQVQFMVETCVKLGVIDEPQELDVPNERRAKNFHELEFQKLGIGIGEWLVRPKHG